MTPQRAHWLLAGIMLVGLALRLVDAAREPLWSDEALTLVIARWPWQDLLFRPVDPTPGLYYLLHKWLIPDGAGVVTIRSISIAAGTLSIPAIYAVARLGISRSAGLLAAALLALSPMLIDYSQEARVYALEILLVLLSAVGLLGWARSLGRQGGGWWLGLFTAATVLAFSSHLAAAFWVAPAVLLAAWATFRRGTADQRRWFLIAMLLMVLGCGVEAQRLLWRASIGGGFNWLRQMTPAAALETLGYVMLPMPRGAAFGLATIIILLIVLGWRIAIHRRRWLTWVRERPVGAGVIAIMLLAPIGVWLFGFVMVPIFMPRTILIAVPGFILLLCLLVHIEQNRWLAPSLVALFLISLLLTGTVRAKEDWGLSVATLRNEGRAGDALITCPEWKYPALRHALGASLRLTGLGPGSRKIVLLETSVAGDSDGMGKFFRTFVEPIMRQKLHQSPAFPTASAPLSAGTVWIVDSQCPPHQWRLVRSWLGEGRYSLRAVSSERPDYDVMRVWRFDGPARVRPVLVAR